jgi:hypothetical protein
MRSQMTFGGLPHKTLRSWKSEIFRDNREALTPGILPDGFILRASLTV